MEFINNVTTQTLSVNHSSSPIMTSEDDVKDTNMTSDWESTDINYLLAARYLRDVCIPIIILVGLCGNSLSLRVFCTQRMRRLRCSVFLMALAVVDNLFLVCLLTTYIDKRLIAILTQDLPCQLVIFVTYATSFLSVWFIVGFTFERFFAICFPLRSHTSSARKGTLAVYIISFLACALYHFSFWTVTVQHDAERSQCAYNYEHFDFIGIATWVDTVITMVIPWITILCINGKVIHSMIKHSNRPIRNNIRSVCRSTRTGASIKTKINNSKLRVTKTLIIVSTTFLVLNLPSHAIRLYNMVRFTSSAENTTSMKFFIIQELCQMFYYMTFSCNIFLYTLFGRTFKQSFKRLILCRPCAKLH